MKKYILRNRHSLLLSVIAAFFALMLLEAAISGRSLFDFDIENSFFELNINESIMGGGLDVLEGLGIHL